MLLVLFLLTLQMEFNLRNVSNYKVALAFSFTNLQIFNNVNIIQWTSPVSFAFFCFHLVVLDYIRLD